MHKILVTGASGFIGSVFCEAALRHGLQVAAAYRSPPSGEHNHPNLTTYSVGDVHRTTEWQYALAGCDTVVHLAAAAHGRCRATDAAYYHEVNTQGTLRLAQQAVQVGVRRFIFVSSIGVNGTVTAPGQAFRETDTPAPKSAYARAKLEAETGLISIAAAAGMEWVILRPPLVYGLNAPGNFHRLIQLVKLGLPLPFASIRNQRSLIGIDNLTDLLLTCTTHPRAANELFLVSDGKDVSTPELLHVIADVIGVKLRLFPVPPALLKAVAACLGQRMAAESLCDSLCIDTAKLQQLLQWVPPASMAEMK